MLAPGRPRLTLAAGGHREERALHEDGAATARGFFDRRIGALPEVVAFTAAFFDRHRIDRALLGPVDFAIEELFTNMVKYGGRAAQVEIRLAPIAGGVEVTLFDRDSDAFDPTRAADADVALPAERRSPGGLGLHLTRRLVDAIEYEYSPERRESRIMFRKTGKPAGTPTEGERDDDDDRVRR